MGRLHWMALLTEIPTLLFLCLALQRCQSTVFAYLFFWIREPIFWNTKASFLSCFAGCSAFTKWESRIGGERMLPAAVTIHQVCVRHPLHCNRWATVLYGWTPLPILFISTSRQKWHLFQEAHSVAVLWVYFSFIYNYHLSTGARQYCILCQ